MDKPTPRTDAKELTRNEIGRHGHGEGTFVESDFARGLERERNELEQTVARLRADAERYRWLRENSTYDTDWEFFGRHVDSEAEFDAAIDAALKSKEPG